MALNVISLRALTILRAQIFFFRYWDLYNGITVASKVAAPTGPPSVNFEGSHAILQAIGPRARLI